MSRLRNIVALLPLSLLGAPVFAADAAAGPTPEAATQAPEDKSGELTEVVITAEKRESTVQQTAISMSALSAEALQNQGISSIEELAGAVPGVSMRTAGPGQTEYEMRGLTSAGGSTATVGFYLDDTPLSASAVALNGRTVIDPDLFDLNNVEVLRGPQGTLYGAGSMGGTIKLVTNKPKLGTFEAATDVNASYTDSGGSANGGGSGMINIPLGDTVAVRVVGTERYISGWINRYVVSDFPFPTNPYGSANAPSNCVTYYCTRGDVQDATPTKIIHGSNLERFPSARALLLAKPTDTLSATLTLMYQRIAADGYNNYQATGISPDPYPSNPGIYQPYDQPEPYYDSVLDWPSLTVVNDFGPVSLTVTPAYWQRKVFQSTDSTEALQNINNLTTFIQNLYSETDPTSQDSIELRLSSNGSGPWQWQGGFYDADLHSGYITHNEEPGFANAVTCGYPSSTSPVTGGTVPGEPAVQSQQPCAALHLRCQPAPLRASGYDRQSERHSLQRQQSQHHEAVGLLRRGLLQDPG